MGKSSLFNRVLGRRAAVVSDRDGVTRDRHYQEADWLGTPFMMVDTGGFLPDDTIDELADSVRQQIYAAIEDSDLILFMVDLRVGATALDQQFSRIVLRTGKPTILVANKGEKDTDRAEGWAFLKLGLGEPRMISALTGYAVRSLLDEVINLLPLKGTAAQNHSNEAMRRGIRFAVLGRPNAGKSTLLNRILGEERAVVSPIPGTTRDSIDAFFTWQDREFVITDTAGLRKKARINDEVEIFSNMRTMESIRRSDLCVLMVDATQGLGIQDFRIITDIRKAGKGLILALNKWDILPEKDHKSYDLIVKDMIDREPMLEWVPIISMSALDGMRVHRLLQEIVTVHSNCFRVLGRDRLAEFFQATIDRHPHTAKQGRTVRLTRACQIMVNPPVVAIETNAPELIEDNYRRYLLKALFEEFQLLGAPLRLNFDRKLNLRKDEDLEHFSELSDGLSTGVDSDSRVGGESMEED